ncbi:hypothetical protein DFH94DRAFT_180865 [Russula ochroleuca]|uniref:Glucose-methanol-choline oxidoreductase C-terminal domain-containing protein n=1 Tax=Russula ochroleuca TaxID=152965 RepID=A0A9P5TE01_9AGAM|nr:hypothetical protein DFH94DRAFT_180865 [Russula ochroleuca]
MSTSHAAGSCSMLPREDGGVVDNKLEVYGTANIWVMDISIIPLHVVAHTQLEETASIFELSSWKLNGSSALACCLPLVLLWNILFLDLLCGLAC